MSILVKITGAVTGFFIGPPLFGLIGSIAIPLIGGPIGAFLGIFIGPIIGWLIAGEIWEQYKNHKEKNKNNKIEQ